MEARSSGSAGARRWRVAFVVGPCALAALVVVGRRVEVADAAAAAPSAGATVLVGATGDANAAAVEVGPTAEPTCSKPPFEAGPPEVGGAPVLFLADGGVVVDLNLAAEEDLRKLPGVGPGRARRILELRTRLGRFRSPDDLARIKGFGRSLLKRLRPMVRAS